MCCLSQAILSETQLLSGCGEVADNLSALHTELSSKWNLPAGRTHYSRPVAMTQVAALHTGDANDANDANAANDDDANIANDAHVHQSHY